MLWKRIVFVGFALAVGLAAGVVGGALVTLRVMRPDPPDLSNIQNWTLIKSFHGQLHPRETPVTARVYVYRKFSDGRDPYTVLQNRIEVIKEDGSQEVFQWPTNEEYAAGWCEIMDVDGDQNKEFLLFMTPLDVSIVRYASGRLDFRPKLDGNVSMEGDIRLLDLDKDGIVEFVVGQPVYEPSLETYFEVPRIRHWSAPKGFEDVSGQFPRYYKEVLVPEIQRKMTNEQDPIKKRLYSRALEITKALR